LAGLNSYVDKGLFGIRTSRDDAQPVRCSRQVARILAPAEWARFFGDSTRFGVGCGVSP
jgi:hypothetical protein